MQDNVNVKILPPIVLAEALGLGAPLEAKFGHAYRHYRAAVPRWISLHSVGDRIHGTVNSRRFVTPS